MKRKLVSAILVLCMGLQLVACGSGGGSGDTDTQSNADTSEGSSGGGNSDGTGVTMKAGYAYESGFVYQGDETIENNTWNQLYQENGINMEVMFNVEESQRFEKLAQLVMSGDYPDFMNVGSSFYKDWAVQGVLADLTDAYDKYASDLTKEFYATEYGQKALESATIDGKLYSMPAPASGYDGLPVLWIRKDWLDNLGLSEPKTVEEFVEVARAFTEDDPDGDGQANTYGLVINGKEVFSEYGGVEGFFQMFGVNPGAPAGSALPFIELDGKAAYGGANADKGMEALTVLNEMFDAGYFAKDFVTTGNEQVSSVLAAGKAGMVFGRMYILGTGWKNALATQPDAEFIAVGLPGVTESDWGQSFYSAIPTGYYSLNVNRGDDEAYMEAFFTIINLSVEYLAQPDTLSQEDYEKYNGKSGEYTGWRTAVAAYGDPVKNLHALEKHQTAMATGDTSAMNAENLRDYESMLDYVDNKDNREELSEDELAAFDNGLFYYSVWGSEQCSYKAISDMIDSDNLLYSAYEIAPTDNMVEYSTTLDTLAKETIIDIAMGNKPVSYYTEFLELWNSLGGDVITAEADEWFQSTK